jgi:hypothetical protein
MAPEAIDGNPDQLRIVLAEFAEQLVVERQLITADWTPVRRVEDEDHGAASQVR